MSILTTAQLTFCDLKDSYSIHMDTDCIGVACGNDGLALESQQIAITYRVLAGTTHIDTVCVVSEFPNGVSLVSNTSALNGQDGVIVLNIAEGATFNYEQSSSIKVVFTTQDDEQFEFEKYITFVKYMKGADGTDAVDFQIYSTDGFEFQASSNSIELKTIAYQSGIEIMGESYQWYYWRTDDSMESGGQYELIPNATSSSIIINKTVDMYAFSSLKCVMMYDELAYEDYITLTEKVSNYTAIVNFFDGSNVFEPGKSYMIVYVALYKDGILENPFKTTKYYYSDNTVQNGNLIDTDIAGDFVDGDYMYFVCSDYSIVLGQYTNDAWTVYNNPDDDAYIYKNDIYPNITSNVFSVVKEDVLRSKTINIEILRNDSSNTTIAVTNVTVMDLNDPVVSADAPTDAKIGQLWLDTSVTPNELKMWDGDGWINSSYQDGGAVYTSEPNDYKPGDIWILGEGEQYGEFGPGSILKATETLAWTDAISDITSTIVNVKESFTWNETGIQIAKKVTDSNGNVTNPFYVHIDSTRMGFHSVNESGVDTEVVHIGNNSSTIKNATFEGDNGTTFANDAYFQKNATFNQQINIIQNNTSLGFVWKIEESNGSLSLAIANLN